VSGRPTLQLTDQALRIGGFRTTNIHFPNHI